MLASIGNIIQGNNSGILIFNANNNHFIVIIIVKLLASKLRSQNKESAISRILILKNYP